jgi:glyoxylase-like metal-dependent hydrolase (beta-lactamase superfamily II)
MSAGARYHPEMRELQPGVWHWQAPHPEWTADQWWPCAVSSYAIDDGTRLIFFDPLSVPDTLLALAREREACVVLTAPWHERDTERLGLPVYTPPPDTADDLVRKYGISHDQIPEGWHSTDVAWLLVEGRGQAHLFLAGDKLPIGVEAYPGRSHNDVVLWVESKRAVIAGDSLVDFGRGFEIPPEVLHHGSTREDVADALRPLLDLPVELVLPAHGEPADRAALERALSA